MSLETWKEEFYPVPADEVPESQALTHSLRKWEGLRKENLEKHGVKRRLHKVGEFHVDSTTCALCHHHAGSFWCYTCPIAGTDEAGNSVNCDHEYIKWVGGGDPEPMIELIKNAINKEK